MVFPLDIRTELHLAGAWTDISSDVYLRDQKVISRGRRDQGASTDPSSLSLTLNNRDGRYTPRNAMSPLYGLIGRNTRVRLSVPGTGSFLQMDADGSKFASTPDAAGLDVTGDLDVRAELAPNWYGPDNQTIIGKWEGTQRSWYVRIAAGVLYFHHRYAATNETWFAGRTLPVLPERAAIRVTFDADNGAGQREARFYWAKSLAGPWTEFADRVVMAGAGGFLASSAPLFVAPTDATTIPASPRLPFSGRAFAFEVRDGINGTVIAAPDFTAQSAGTTSFTDSAGRPWSLADGTEIRDREDRFVGEISTWPAKWTVDGSDVWVPIQASGILRRLGQGQKPLDSTLRRRIPSGNPVAYWPMEDEGLTTRAYSPLPGVEPAAVQGLEFASLDTLVSSAPLPRLTKAGSLSAKVPASMPSGAWQVEFVYNADDKPPADYTELFNVTSPDGMIRRWKVSIKKDAAKVQGFLTDTQTLVSLNIGVGADVFHGWVRLRLYAYTEAGITNWRLDFQDVGGGAGGAGSSFPGSAGRVSYVTAAWSAPLEGWGFGHLVVLPEANSTLLNGSDDAFHGETAWGRMLRLASEERLPLARIPGELTTERVGYQRQGTILELLGAAATADGGMLLEDPRRIGLIYRDRSSLYTQEPALTLSYTAPGLGPDLEPVDDDSAVRNDVTVTRDGGSAGRAFLADGPLSVQSPPYGIGLYDESVTLSLAHDTQPEPVANWRLHLGTYDGSRYPTVSVTIHKPGAEVHIPAVLALKEGDVIRLTDLPPWVAHGDVDLIVEGRTETLDMYRWTIDFNCSPGGPWNTAVASHPVYGKADTDGSALATPATATATTLDVQTTAGPAWTTDPAHMPIPLQIGGEEVLATAVTPVSDTFTRTVASGWGSTPGGLPWLTAGGAASDRSVNGSQGVIAIPSAISTVRFQYLAGALADAEVRVRLSAAQVSTGASLVPAVLLRYVNASTYYRARLHFATGGELYVSITRDTTQIGPNILLPFTYTAGATFEVRAQVSGQTVRIKVWPSAAVEPAAWSGEQIVTVNPIVAGAVGLTGSGFAGGTNVNPSIRYDNFEVVGTQRFTVTRSVNGVTKPHSAGAPVRLAHPAIASL
ncbi:hypothetical protein [Streptomyces sp. NPDC058644]|uniref:hypothetical protein n=1 Tax=unclassified Streptomyces TaxID=2593676 RepID=UPI00364F5DE3